VIPGYRARRDFYIPGVYDETQPRCNDEECVALPPLVPSYLEILFSHQMNEAVRAIGGLDAVMALTTVVQMIRARILEESSTVCRKDRNHIYGLLQQSELALLPPAKANEE
jgi:hypothetical protein